MTVKQLLVLAIMMIACKSVVGDFTPKPISLHEMAAKKILQEGTILKPDRTSSFLRVRIQNVHRTPKMVKILEYDNPKPTQFYYGIHGNIMYKNVEQRGYLEMQSTMPDGRVFSMKTLGSSGWFECISGSSDWREFDFFLSRNPKNPVLPVKLTLYLVLPSIGEVTIGGLEFLQADPPDLSVTIEKKPATYWTQIVMILLLIGCLFYVRKKFSGGLRTAGTALVIDAMVAVLAKSAFGGSSY